MNIVDMVKSIGLTAINYEKNVYLLRQKSQVSNLIFCTNASLTISYVNVCGNEFILKVEDNYTGFLGEMEFFQENNNSLFSVRANRPGNLYKISKSNFLTILGDNPEVFIYITSLITKRYNRNMHELIKNITQSTRVSIINQILDAKSRASDDFFKLSTTLGAKKLGITTRTYRRILNDLLQEGRIEKSKPYYKIINL